jgi:hypothetical protein
MNYYRASESFPSNFNFDLWSPDDGQVIDVGTLAYWDHRINIEIRLYSETENTERLDFANGQSSNGFQLE